MANKATKAERSAAKDKRQMPPPEKHKPTKRKRKKKKRNYKVSYKSNRTSGLRWMREWRTFGYYERYDVAKTAMKREQHKAKSMGLDWEYKLEEL